MELTANSDLLSIPFELLCAIVKYAHRSPGWCTMYKNIWGATQACKDLRRACLQVRTSRDDDLPDGNYCAWRVVAATTIDELELIDEYPWTKPKIFQLCTVPTLTNILEGAEQLDTDAAANLRRRVDDICVKRFRKHPRDVLIAFSVVTPSTLVRLAMVISYGLGKDISEHLITSGRCKELPPAFAIALWYFTGCYPDILSGAPKAFLTAVKCALSVIAQEMAPFAQCEIDVYELLDNISPELKWAMAAVAIASNGSRVARRSRSFKCLKAVLRELCPDAPLDRETLSIDMVYSAYHEIYKIPGKGPVVESERAAYWQFDGKLPHNICELLAIVRFS